mmetsp:Transcript_17798/g.62417  ORF Transcript_17798/g.62417 Transcript_17798/m.62417 type:complete len:288 (-) Transcript_17798:3629-4492(-)
MQTLQQAFRLVLLQTLMGPVQLARPQRCLKRLLHRHAFGDAGRAWGPLEHEDDVLQPSNRLPTPFLAQVVVRCQEPLGVLQALLRLHDLPIEHGEPVAASVERAALVIEGRRPRQEVRRPRKLSLILARVLLLQCLLLLVLLLHLLLLLFLLLLLLLLFLLLLLLLHLLLLQAAGADGVRGAAEPAGLGDEAVANCLQLGRQPVAVGLQALGQALGDGPLVQHRLRIVRDDVLPRRAQHREARGHAEARGGVRLLLAAALHNGPSASPPQRLDVLIAQQGELLGLAL